MAKKKKKTKKKTKKAKKKKSCEKYFNKETQKNVGYWVFLVGIFVSIIAGLLTIGAMQPDPNIIWILAVLGLIVGLMNLKIKDEVPFLIATIVLITAAGYLALIPYVGETLTTILQYIVVFVAPAAIIVALKAIYEYGKK